VEGEKIDEDGKVDEDEKIDEKKWSAPREVEMGQGSRGSDHGISQKLS
jgi:hypothetical protein